MNPFKNFDVTGSSKIWSNVPEMGLMRFLYIFVYYFSAIIRLNLIFLLFCLPLITMPLAFIGMARITTKLVKLEPVEIWGDFIRAIKKDWKQAVVVFYVIVVCMAASIVAFGFYLRNGNNNMFSGLGLMLCGLIIIVLILMMVYSMSMITTVSLKTQLLLKNALLLCVLGGKDTLFILISVILVLGTMVLLLPVSILFAVLMGFASLGLLCSIYALHPIEKYAVVK